MWEKIRESDLLTLCGLIVFEVLFTLTAYSESQTVRFWHYLNGMRATEQVAVGMMLFGCLGVLVVLTIGTFFGLKKLKIIPAPIVTPLFVLLTISVVYQNYVGEPYRESVSEGEPLVRSVVTVLRAPGKHMLSIVIGLGLFFLMIGLSKVMSQLRLEDYEYRLMLYVSWVLCIISCFGTFLKIGSQQIQPGEILKFWMLFITGIGYPKIQQNLEIRRLYLKTIVGIMLVFLIIRDFGNAMVMAVILLTVLFMTYRLRVALKLTLAGGVFMLLFFKIYTTLKKESPIVWRITDTFKGLTHANKSNWELRVAYFAALKNGIFGGGTGSNEYLLNNVNAYTDVAFDGIVALFGVAPALLVVGCLIYLIFICRIRTTDAGQNYPFYFFANTMTIILGAQAIIHVGGNLNVFPFTGIILPFVSRGGTAMVMSFVEIGCALGGRVPDEQVVQIVRWLEKILNRFRPQVGSAVERMETSVSRKTRRVKRTIAKRMPNGLREVSRNMTRTIQKWMG